MSPLHKTTPARRPLAAVFLLVLGMALSARLCAQMVEGVPTVQQNQFRSQWVGEQVDQIGLGSAITPQNSLGAVVGALQTQDEVQREVESSLAGVKQQSPFAFKPALGVGWQISNQGLTNAPAPGNTNTSTSYSTGSSPFVAPSVAFLYDRIHGPWGISAGYSAGYKYFSNPNFVANGTGATRNPFSQTGLLKVILEMSRYVWSTLVTVSQGSGFDLSSGSNNLQLNANANTEFKYLLSQDVAAAVKAGYSFQNASQGSNTPNNNVSSYYAQAAPIYDLSDKTHLSAIFGSGGTYQSLQQSSTATGTNAAGNLNGLTSSSIQYVQAMGKTKWEMTGKLSTEVSLGVRELWMNNSTNATASGSSSSSNLNRSLGLKPAWTVGLNYTPTAKTSLAFSMGEQGTDIVPELNFALNWQPRQKTSVSLGVSQSETYSNIAASQYLVQRGVVGTVNQTLFSNVTLSLSGGYTTQFYQNITGGQAVTTGSAAQIPGSYYLATASLVWKIRDWVNLNNTVYYNSGQSIQSGANNSALAQIWYSVSLNFSL